MNSLLRSHSVTWTFHQVYSRTLSSLAIFLDILRISEESQVLETLPEPYSDRFRIMSEKWHVEMLNIVTSLFLLVCLASRRKLTRVARGFMKGKKALKGRSSTTTYKGQSIMSDFDEYETMSSF